MRKRYISDGMFEVLIIYIYITIFCMLIYIMVLVKVEIISYLGLTVTLNKDFDIKPIQKKVKISKKILNHQY